jgi:hypothetical protein
MADPLNVLAIDDVRRITRLEVVPLDRLRKSDHRKAAQSGNARRQHGGYHQDAQHQAEIEAEAENLDLKETTEDINLDELAASTEEGPVIKLANACHRQGDQDRASVFISNLSKDRSSALPHRWRLISATPPPKTFKWP